MKMQNISQRVAVISNNCVCKPVLETKNKKNTINEELYILKKNDVTLKL